MLKVLIDMNNLRKILVLALSLMLFVSFNLQFKSVSAGTFKKLSLPSSSLPMGIVYNPYNSMVYVALCRTGQLAEINKTSLSYVLYDIACGACIITLDSYGNVWVTPKSYGNSIIAKFDIATKQVQYIELGTNNESNCLTFHNGYIWVGVRQIIQETGVGKAILLKVNPIDNVVVNSYVLSVPEFCPEFNGYIEFIPFFMKGYENELWISLLNKPPEFEGFEGRVVMFDILNEDVTIVTPFDRPLGIDVDSDYVYVAEATWSPRLISIDPYILVGDVGLINKRDLSVKKIAVRVYCEGPFSVYKDSNGYVWYLTSAVAGIVDVANLKSGYVWGPWAEPVPPIYNFFMTEVPFQSALIGDYSEVWFSGAGSAYVSMKDTILSYADLNIDGIIDVKDVSRVAKAFGSYEGSANWDVKCDIDKNGKVDVKDVSSVAKNFGKTI